MLHGRKISVNIVPPWMLIKTTTAEQGVLCTIVFFAIGFSTSTTVIYVFFVSLCLSLTTTVVMFHVQVYRVLELASSKNSTDLLDLTSNNMVDELTLEICYSLFCITFLIW